MMWKEQLDIEDLVYMGYRVIASQGFKNESSIKYQVEKDGLTVSYILPAEILKSTSRAVAIDYAVRMILDMFEKEEENANSY